jgi:magnesium transporter
MSTEILEASIHDTKESILNKITAEHEYLETIHDIYIIDDQKRLIGTCSLFDLLSNPDNIPIQDLMEDKDIKALTPDAHWKDIAEYMSKYNLITVPIWNHNKELLGIVSVDDILPWLLGEH